ncbi:MAG: 50S ribosomal protein L9 [Acidimicrobiales bacterium]|nr:50S ribosomal protein L9 [Acidimicrobiales bacterium]
MRLLLRTDVDGLGKRGDLVDVADGYARNFLVPKGLAIKATPGVEAQAESMRRARMLKDAADRAAAEEIAKQLVPLTITITARAGKEGKLFGSVTTADIAEAVQDQARVGIDKRHLVLPEPIKQTGTHMVTAKLHTDVEFQFAVEVRAT